MKVSGSPSYQEFRRMIQAAHNSRGVKIEGKSKRPNNEECVTLEFYPPLQFEEWVVSTVILSLYDGIWMVQGFNKDGQDVLAYSAHRYNPDNLNNNRKAVYAFLALVSQKCCGGQHFQEYMIPESEKSIPVPTQLSLY